VRFSSGGGCVIISSAKAITFDIQEVKKLFMSQNPQNPRPNKNPPLTSAQQKRQNVVQMRQERQERQQSAQQQGRWLIISAIAVIVVIAVGVIIYAVINGQNKNTNSRGRKRFFSSNRGNKKLI